MRKGVAPWKVVAAIVVVLILIYSAYSLMQPGTTAISAMTSLSISANQTVLVRLYSSNPIAIRLQSASNSSALFYITTMPVLYGPVSSVVLMPTVGANVSSNGTRIADMNLKLVGTGMKGATIDVTPLPASLGILASPSILILAPAAFFSSASSNMTLATSTTLSTSSSTIPQATTTIVQNSTASLLQQALSLMNGTEQGMLMKEYKTLYISDIGCSETTYNSTYNIVYGTLPPAFNSYYNTSQLIPRDLTINETALPAKDNVQITYSTLSESSESTGPALVATINTVAPLYLKSLNFVGVYMGLNYSTLNSSYAFQRSIGNNCDAWIPPK